MRVISKRLRESSKSTLHTSTVWRYLKEACLNCKNTIEVGRELKPRWSGYLHVDGKGIKIKGKKLFELTLFVGEDKCGDIVHVGVMEGENKEDLRRFFRELKEDIKYPFRGLVSDMDEDIIWARKEELGDIPHQFCTTHMLRRIDELTSYVSIRSQLGKLKKRLKVHVI